MCAYRKSTPRSSPLATGDDPLWRLSRDLLVVTGRDTAILAANPAWETALGWRPGDLAGRPFLDLAHPEDRPVTQAEIARLREGADPITLEARMRQGDGSYRRLAWTFTASDASFHGLGRPVVSARAVAEAFRGNGEQIRRLFEQAPGFVVVLAGRITCSSSSTRHMNSSSVAARWSGARRPRPCPSLWSRVFSISSTTFTAPAGLSSASACPSGSSAFRGRRGSGVTWISSGSRSWTPAAVPRASSPRDTM